MSEQIGLMESELETNSYRYYYDKWIEIEGGFSKDVLKKRFRELADDEKKLDEIINFIMYLDSQLSYQESSKKDTRIILMKDTLFSRFYRFLHIKNIGKNTSIVCMLKEHFLLNLLIIQ